MVGAQPWSQEEESGAGGGPARPTCLPRWAVGQGALTWEGELAARQAWVQPTLPAFLFLPGLSSLDWRLQKDQVVLDQWSIRLNK